MINRTTSCTGYIQEMFSSFQGEGAAISGSCYGLRQIFVRFSGCSLFLGALGTNGCIWCDSPKSQHDKISVCYVEKKAGAQSFEEQKNPLSVDAVIDVIKKLSTNDLHSISLTGGEPLYQPAFLHSLLEALKQENYKTYLESAYTHNLNYLDQIGSKIDFACIDIKDRTANAALSWESLVKQEVAMCEILQSAGVKVFAKVVINKASKIDDFSFIVELCAKEEIPIVIQLLTVTPSSTTLSPPTWEQIQKFTDIAGKHLSPSKIGLSAQVHKLIDIL